MAGADELDRLLAEHATWLTVERGLAANTLEAYRRDLAAYAGFLRRRAGGAAVDVGRLAEADVDAYAEHLTSARAADGKPRWSAASVARAIVAVRSFHRFCLTEGHVVGDPSEDVAAPRVPQGIPKALTEAEVEALLAAVTGDGPAALRDRAILETLYACGLRISELVGLDVGAVDLEEGFLRAFGKGAKERIVPVGHTAAAAIEAWLPARAAVLARARPGRAAPDALFLNPRGGRLTRQGAWQIVAAYGLRAGLGGRLSPHVLRHSCATHMVDRGADLRVVQELLGHASVSTTQIYTKVTQSRLRAVYDAAHPRAKRLNPATVPVPLGGRGA
jgi:integrase/recombinase XerD